MAEEQQLGWWSLDSLAEVRSVLPVTGGWLAAQVPLHASATPDAVLKSLRSSGWVVKGWWVGEAADFGDDVSGDQNPGSEPRQQILRVAAWSLEQ